MIKRIFLAALASMAITGFVTAHGTTLWEHFEGVLPEKSERALMYYDYDGDIYSGTKEQNIFLLDNLHNGLNLGALAFPPSTVEGTSTAGWTDDGSIVRLNTAADSVGIGTANPSEKLTVQGGNFYLSGTLRMSGGTFDFSNGSATTTLSVTSLGLGVGTTTPRRTFSVQGEAMISGTTTVSALTATGTITTTGNLRVDGTTKLNSIEYTWPSADGGSGQQLQTNGSRTLTWADASSGASALASTTAKQNLASGTTTLMSLTVPASKITAGESILITVNTTMVGNTAGGGVDEAGSLNVSLGGYATSTCGWQIGRVGLSNASAYATSTYTFHIRASSNTTQDVVCNQVYKTSPIDESVGYTPFNKPGIQSPDSAIDYAEASGTVDLTTAQPLLIHAYKEDADSATNRWRILSLIVQYLID